MDTEDSAPHALPASTPRLAEGLPAGVPARPGTIFALADTGGYAVPPRPFELTFGRGAGEARIAIGTHDPYVSRLHGTLTCDGHNWRLRNDGRLPICLPDGPMVLSGHELPIAPGYTPIHINTPANRSYLLEIHVVPAAASEAPAAPEASAAAAVSRFRTCEPDVCRLTEDERLVLVVLAQRYLRQERHPHPVSWKQVAEDLTRIAPTRGWTPGIAAHVVASVRDRLAAARPDDALADPEAAALDHNLIRALLKTTTLIPADLELLRRESPE